jgi:adenylate kinase
VALNLVMLGPPGAGKGTQAERLARARGIPKISTGDMLREAVHEGTALGRRVQAAMDRGELVGDEVMTGMVRERLDRPDAGHGFVLDGFPRTVAQAVSLDRIMDGRGPLIVVDIAVSEEEIARRLGGRMICAECGANAGNLGLTTVDSVDRASAVVERCHRCGGSLVQRADDAAGVVLERMRVYHVQTEPLVEYYRKRPTFRSVHGGAAPDAVTAVLAAAVDAAAALAGVGSAARGTAAS